MFNKENNLKIVRKEFINDRTLDNIRIGNNFVDDFIFDEKNQAADIPINALRVIFNIISIISNEQFRPDDRPKQLSLFDEEFETENNTFALLKIRNSKISPSSSTKQVVSAYEFLTKFKMGWYKSLNSKGREIKTFAGLISTPTYDERRYTSFLISSYWLKKLIVIPEYNYVLYHLVYNVKNNKHIIFAICLAKIPSTGTVLKLSTFNAKFDFNYKTSNDFCFKFLKPLKFNLDRYSTLSFNFKYRADNISILPYSTNSLEKTTELFTDQEHLYITYRINYFKKRYKLVQNEIEQFSFQYRNLSQTRQLVEKSYKYFIKNTRKLNRKSSDFKGKEFLEKLLQIMIDLYRTTRMGKLLPNGCPTIL